MPLLASIAIGLLVAFGVYGTAAYLFSFCVLMILVDIKEAIRRNHTTPQPTDKEAS